jgi:predicted oxidoreductase
MPSSLVDAGPRTIVGRDVGPFSFGCWRFVGADDREADAVVETALDLGMNLVDTADVYGFDWGGEGMGHAERRLGGVLARHPAWRDRMVLATKGGIIPGVPYDSSPDYLRSACEASLDRLGVDHVDLYLIHRPDLYAHPAAVAETLLALRDEGKIGAIGVSNHTVDQTRALEAHLGEPVAATQPEFSAAHLDPMRDGTFDHAMATGSVPMVWSPLAGGALATGDGLSPELRTTLDELAADRDTDRTTIALAFVLAHPARPVAILGTQNRERMRSSAAAGRIHLERADVYRIIEASEGVPLP